MRGISYAFLIAIVVSLAAGITNDSKAQLYPSRPVTMVVPFGAGGGTDSLGRTLAEGMKQPLGQPVIIQNISGAAGSIGVARASRAAADGYTLILGNWATHVVNGAVRSLPYDVLNDFAPVSLVATQPLVIVASNAVPAKDLKELIAWLKANPDKASFGMAGSGSSTHIAAVFFQKETGTRFQFVPYRGGAQMMKDLMGGQIELAFTQASNALAHLKHGKIKAYAVTAPTRLTAAPELPTVDEGGLSRLHISLWHAFWVPGSTPKEVISKLNAAAMYALADSTTRERITNVGQVIFPRDQQSPEALAAFHKAEIDKWWPIIKAANIKAE